MTNQISKLGQELRKRFKTPAAALKALRRTKTHTAFSP